MSANRKTVDKKEEDLIQIANSSNWSALHNVSDSPFTIKSKKSVVDIDSINKNIQQDSEKEDLQIQKENTASENAINTTSTNTISSPAANTTNNINNAQSSNITKNVAQVSTQKTENKSVEEKVTFVKQIDIGLTHLFIINATSLLKPMNFVVQNAAKILMALIHMTMPLLMTWWLMSKVDFISIQLQKESHTMFYVYGVIFYLACAFLWIVMQVLAKGIYISFKNSLKEVAEIGKNKN